MVLPPAARRTLLLLLWFCLGALPAAAEVVDRVVAEVNDDIITLSELEEQGRSVFRQVALEVPAQDRLAAIAQVRRDILEGLIDQKLIEQEAARLNVDVSEAELDEYFEQVLAMNDMSRETLLEELERSGLDEAAYRENLRIQVLRTKLINREIRSKIVITEEAILDYYDTRYTTKIKEGGYYLLQIGIGWGEQDGSDRDPAQLAASKEEALQRAERVHQLARSGGDFRELARKFSDLPSAADGGDLGVFDEKEMASYMRNAVVSLDPGDVSAIVETPVGYQFFKLLSSREGGIVLQAPYESVKEEIRETLYEQALEKEFKEWIEGIRERAYIRTSL